MAGIFHVKSNAVADGTNTSVVRPIDWNSSHSIDAGVIVNLANSQTTYSSGTVSLVASGVGMTIFSTTGQQFIFSHGPAMGGFEPFNMANPLSTTYLPAIGSWYFQPFYLPDQLSSGHIAQLYSYGGTSNAVLQGSNGVSYASNTTGTASNRQSFVQSIALYSIGTGTNSTRLESLWSNTFGVAIDRSVSVILTNATHVRATFAATMSYVSQVGADGAYTTTTLAGSTSSSSASVSMATAGLSVGVSSLMNRLSGQMRIPVGFNTTFDAGMYWFAWAYSSSSTTGGSTLADGWPIVNKVGLYGMSSMPFRRFGQTVSNTSQQNWLAQGRYSAVSAVPPPTVEFTQVRSVASHITEYWNHHNQTL